MADHVPVDRSLQNSLIATTVIFTVLASIFVILRIVARGVIVRVFGADDWTMMAAWLFSLAYMTEILIGKNVGMGLHGSLLSPDDMVSLLQNTLAIEITYYLVVFSIKISILFFYLRIAADKTFRALTIGTIVLMAAFAVSCVAVCLFQCRPLKMVWNIDPTVQPNCINTTAFFYFTSSFNIVTDIWILALPVKTLLSVQRPKREKAALLVIFGMGVFSCVASVVRLYTIKIFTLSNDKFYDAGPINLWSQIEVNIAIVCACIPALRPIMSRKQRQRSRRARAPSGGFYIYEGSERSGRPIPDSREGKPMPTITIGSADRSRDNIRMTSFVSGGRTFASRSDNFDQRSSQEELTGRDKDLRVIPEQPYNGPGIYYQRDVQVNTQ